MSNEEQQEQEHRSRVTTLHTRMLAYIVAGCVFATGVYKGFYDNYVILIIPLTVLIPWGQRFLYTWLQSRYPRQANATLMLTDGFAAGLGIAAAGFSLVPTMTFLGLLVTTAMAFGNLYLVTLTGFVTLFGSLLGGFLFSFQSAGNDSPALMTVVAFGGYTLFVGLSAFYIREQQRNLLAAKNKILEQHRSGDERDSAAGALSKRECTHGERSNTQTELGFHGSSRRCTGGYEYEG